ncbi:ATP-binding protein [Desulfonema magnum]|uniref:Histidine kinase domain-containing protein n=1 Tax=Desulfonema magnum TaxID=45655 RepID=A0A975BMU3_9BACT|nr:ATP-binding protein [Desulfonema magnum]QTA88447.1 Histidine kinase domain-containing protein [Desulfonema magnum]
MNFLSQITLPATLDNLSEFIESVKSCAKKQGFSQKRISEIELSLEEVLVNIFDYAYKKNETGDVKVSYGPDDDNHFVIQIEDAGMPFDMLSLDKPDLTADVSEREIGGIGVFLVRELMDDVQYRRENAKNILTLKVRN